MCYHSESPSDCGRISPVPIKLFCWMLVLYEWRSMEKTQNMNDVQQRTGQEMHREVRATLTSISELSLSVRRWKT
jgi:hypothetical protein